MQFRHPRTINVVSSPLRLIASPLNKQGRARRDHILMHIINVSVRQSRRYGDGFSHLDMWGSDFKLKALPARLVQSPIGLEEDTVLMQTLIVPRSALASAGSRTARRHVMQQIKQAIADTYSGSKCTHEYDCCGCVTRRAYVVHSNRRTLSVRIHSFRNV